MESEKWKFVQGGLSKEYQKDWTNASQLTRNSDMERNILAYLKWNLKNRNLTDLPCYTNPLVQDEFRKRIRTKCKRTPSHSATYFGYTEIVKLLAPLTDNPNEIQRILKSFTTGSSTKTGGAALEESRPFPDAWKQ